VLDIEIKDGDIINIIVDGVEWKGCLVREDEKGRLFAIRLLHSPMEIADITSLKKKKDVKKGKRIRFLSKKYKKLIE